MCHIWSSQRYFVKVLQVPPRHTYSIRTCTTTTTHTAHVHMCVHTLRQCHRTGCVCEPTHTKDLYVNWLNCHFRMPQQHIQDQASISTSLSGVQQPSAACALTAPSVGSVTKTTPTTSVQVGRQQPSARPNSVPCISTATHYSSTLSLTLCVH